MLFLNKSIIGRLNPVVKISFALLSGFDGREAILDCEMRLFILTGTYGEGRDLIRD